MKTLSPVLVITFVWLIQGCAGTQEAADQAGPRLLLVLPDHCNTPDGCTLTDDGDIILSIPNFNNQALIDAGNIEKPAPALMVKIDPQNKLTTWYEFQEKDLHPDTKKVGPMGGDVGPDGNLYVADNQFFDDPAHKSRLLRINIEDGKAVSCESVVEGFIVSNAVIWRGDTVYVSETYLDPKPRPLPSGVYAFKISELKGKKPVKLKPWTKDKADPHLIATFHTSGKIGFGADGLTFDADGNLYCSIFEDGVIYKITFDKAGKVTSNEVWAKAPHMKSSDGIFYNAPDKKIYVADMVINAVQVVDLSANVVTVASNGNTDGRNGLIDQPCEVIVRGKDLIVVNMDMPFPGIVNTKFDKPWSLSVIKLD